MILPIVYPAHTGSYAEAIVNRFKGSCDEIAEHRLGTVLLAVPGGVSPDERESRTAGTPWPRHR